MHACTARVEGDKTQHRRYHACMYAWWPAYITRMRAEAFNGDAWQPNLKIITYDHSFLHRWLSRSQLMQYAIFNEMHCMRSINASLAACNKGRKAEMCNLKRREKLFIYLFIHLSIYLFIFLLIHFKATLSLRVLTVVFSFFTLLISRQIKKELRTLVIYLYFFSTGSE